jgi:hypothetical protein
MVNQEQHHQIGQGVKEKWKWMIVWSAKVIEKI